MMPRISSIRVGTDLSTHAERAVQQAAWLARDAGIERGVLVHALGLGRFHAFRELFSGGDRLEKELEENARAELQELANRVREETGFGYEIEVHNGTAVEALAEGGEPGALVVTGAKGYHAFGEVALGSTSERVVRGTENPVLVARNNIAGGYRKVVVAVDFSAHSRAALQHARVLAPEAELHLVHAYPAMPSSGQSFAGITPNDVKRLSQEMEQRSERELDAMLAECDMARGDLASLVMEHAYAPQLIWENAEQRGAELVVMGKQGHSRFRDWMVGSVTAHVLARCSADVMIVRDRRA